MSAISSTGSACPPATAADLAGIERTPAIIIFPAVAGSAESANKSGQGPDRLFEACSRAHSTRETWYLRPWVPGCRLCAPGAIESNMPERRCIAAVRLSRCHCA